jgi:hypothetical protein
MVAHESVQMSIEEDTLERFRQGVREVDRGINPLELDVVSTLLSWMRSFLQPTLRFAK